MRVLCVFLIPTWALAANEGGKAEVDRQESLVSDFLRQSVKGAVTARLATATVGCLMDSESACESLIDSVAREFPCVYESPTGRYHIDVLVKAIVLDHDDSASVRFALAESATERLWQDVGGEDRYLGIANGAAVGSYFGGVGNLPLRDYVGSFWSTGESETSFTVMARSLGEARDMILIREDNQDLRVSVWNEEDAAAKRSE